MPLGFLLPSLPLPSFPLCVSLQHYAKDLAIALERMLYMCFIVCTTQKLGIRFGACESSSGHTQYAHHISSFPKESRKPIQRWTTACAPSSVVHAVNCNLLGLAKSSLWCLLNSVPCMGMGCNLFPRFLHNHRKKINQSRNESGHGPVKHFVHLLHV
jgi:hypothetical protein